MWLLKELCEDVGVWSGGSLCDELGGSSGMYGGFREGQEGLFLGRRQKDKISLTCGRTRCEMMS